MIDVFTSETTLTKYDENVKVNSYLLQVTIVRLQQFQSDLFLVLTTALFQQLFSYLIKNKYFEKFRDLVEQRVPPMLEPSAHPPTAFAASLIDFIQRPLKLVFSNCDHSFK